MRMIKSLSEGERKLILKVVQGSELGGRGEGRKNRNGQWGGGNHYDVPKTLDRVGFRVTMRATLVVTPSSGGYGSDKTPI